MYLLKTVAGFATIAAVVSATPTPDKRSICIFDGDCWSNGCGPSFAYPSDTQGICTTGSYTDCPCNKCGIFTGSCADNGCYGIQGTCTEGQYQGCPCN